MERRTMLIIVGGVLVLSGALYFLFVPQTVIEGPTPSQSQATSTEAIEFSVATKEIQEETDEYVVNITYPVLSGEEEVFAQINKNIENIIDGRRNDFLDSVALFGSDVSIPGAKSGLYIEPEEITSGRSSVSVPLLVSEYMEGAAHPNNYMRTLNYDLATGRELELDDLFTGDDYLKLLSTRSRAALERGEGREQYVPEDAEWLAKGTAPDEKNFSFFLIDGDDIVIIFNPYQIAPYAAGIMRARIPIEELEGFVR